MSLSVIYYVLHVQFAICTCTLILGHLMMDITDHISDITPSYNRHALLTHGSVVRCLMMGSACLITGMPNKAQRTFPTLAIDPFIMSFTETPLPKWLYLTYATPT